MDKTKKRKRVSGDFADHIGKKLLLGPAIKRIPTLIGGAYVQPIEGIIEMVSANATWVKITFLASKKTMWHQVEDYEILDVIL